MGRKEFVTRVWKDMLTRGGVEQVLVDKLRIVGAERNKVVATLPVEKKHTNRLGFVHGGVVSTLADIGGSLALAANGMYMTGVTTDLSTTYLGSSGKPGDELEMHCHCQKMGRTMAYTFIEFYNPRTRDLVARGSHTKYIAHAWKSDENVKFD